MCYNKEQQTNGSESWKNVLNDKNVLVEGEDILWIPQEQQLDKNVLVEGEDILWIPQELPFDENAILEGEDILWRP